MQRNHIKIISFDMNGTLTQDHFIEFIWRDSLPRLYSQKKNMPFEEAKEYVFSEYDKVGDRRVEWYDIKYWFSFFELGEGWRKLMESCQYKVATFPEVVPVLEELGRYYTLVVTTNATTEFHNIELGAAGINEYFARVFSSTSDFGQVKKTPESYQEICNILEVRPEEMVHVGDHRHFDFVAPQELGIRAYYLDRRGEEEGDHVVRDLEEFNRKLAQVR